MSTTLERDAHDLSVSHNVWIWAEKQKMGGMTVTKAPSKFDCFVLEIVEHP